MWLYHTECNKIESEKALTQIAVDICSLAAKTKPYKSLCKANKLDFIDYAVVDDDYDDVVSSDHPSILRVNIYRLSLVVNMRKAMEKLEVSNCESEEWVTDECNSRSGQKDKILRDELCVHDGPNDAQHCYKQMFVKKKISKVR